MMNSIFVIKVMSFIGTFLVTSLKPILIEENSNGWCYQYCWIRILDTDKLAEFRGRYEKSRCPVCLDSSP